MIKQDLIQKYIDKFDMKSFLNSDLIDHINVFEYESYKTVFFEQEKIKHLYFLVEGELRCAHYDPNGNLAVVAMSTPLTAIGDVEILGKYPASTAVMTTKPSLLLGIPMESIQKYGLNNPEFLKFIIEELVEKLNYSTSLRLGHLLPVKSRLALYILTQTEEDKVIILPEKEVLASMLGTTTRHLNRVLKELVNKEAVGQGYPGLKIRDKKYLNSLIE